jgi:hypothetical protein
VSDTTKPWAGMDPNSQHQTWSVWSITVPWASCPKRPGLADIRENGRRFFRQLFRTDVGQMRVGELTRPAAPGAVPNTPWALCIECRVEGVAVHDPQLRAAAERQIRDHFLARGFGQAAADQATVDAVLLAGDTQDGKPPQQVIVLPTIH